MAETVTCKKGMKVISLWDKESGSYAIYHIHLRADHVQPYSFAISVLSRGCSFFLRILYFNPVNLYYELAFDIIAEQQYFPAYAPLSKAAQKFSDASP
jgi:hypothetical protein